MIELTTEITTDHEISLRYLTSKINQSEVFNREQKVELCKKEMGKNYLLHPSNFIKHKDGRQS